MKRRYSNRFTVLTRGGKSVYLNHQIYNTVMRLVRKLQDDEKIPYAYQYEAIQKGLGGRIEISTGVRKAGSDSAATAHLKQAGYDSRAKKVAGKQKARVGKRTRRDRKLDKRERASLAVIARAAKGSGVIGMAVEK